MGINIRITDEHFGKSKLSIFEIEYPSEDVTIREIITRRVEEEVARVTHAQQNTNHIKAEHRMFLAGLTKLSPEVLLNQVSMTKQRKLIDVASAVKTAFEAFNAGKYFVLVNDFQYENLNDKVKLTPNTEVIFLRLTPLQGG